MIYYKITIEQLLMYFHDKLCLPRYVPSHFLVMTLEFPGQLSN